MNQTQRDALADIVGQLEEIEAEERDKRENAPENLYDSEQYEKMEENADSLSEAIDTLKEITEG